MNPAVNTASTPYQELPPRSFWRTAVVEPEPLDIGDLWTPKFAIGQDDPILTAGSCFARHIGRALLEHGLNWRDAEPAPPGLTAQQRLARHYGVFSFRTGNVYTAALLRQWLAWAFGAATQPTTAWEEGGRWFDPYRPAVEPDGHPSAEAMLSAREHTLAAIRRVLAEASVLVFTLGLTEAWLDTVDGTMYPMCPGTVRGAYDPLRHAFHNFTFAEVHRDLSTAIALAREVNPGLRVLLTVSPVPLTATATGEHALAATTYSKSVLRAVAGQLTGEHEHVDYFPSYELISAFPFRAAFYEPNLRTVTPEGVAFVMRQFFAALRGAPAAATQPGAATCEEPPDYGEDLLCDDAVLDYHRG